MPAPPNTSLGTATAIGSLPQSITQTGIHDAGTTYPVWYKYTATSDDIVIGLWGFGGAAGSGYQPDVTVWLDAVTQYLGGYGADNIPIQVPVDAGTTYYFKFTPNGGNPNPATLTLAVERHADRTPPTGSIVVNDDTEGFPCAVLDPNSGEVLRFVNDFPSGEQGDVLDNGIACVHDNVNLTLAIYAADLSRRLTTVTGIELEGLLGSLRTCLGTQRWWFSTNPSGTSHARYITSDGTLGTDHTLTGIAHIGCLAASNDETILYHNYSGGGAGTKQIHRWDLVNDAALSDLAASFSSTISDILVLGDDTIVALYMPALGLGLLARRFSPDGTVLNTYTFGASGDFVFPAGTLPRLAYGIGSTTFWVWTHPSGSNEGRSRFQQVSVGNGAILSTVYSREYESGIYNGDQTTAPDRRFGNSFSCPFWISRTPITPDYEIVEEPIVRERIFPLLNHEMKRISVNCLHLDCQVGYGTTTGQGSDPKIELQVSHDGAHTWGPIKIRSLGAKGLYRTLVRWWQFGTARVWGFRIRQSDPVQSAWIAAYLHGEEEED